MKKIILAVVVLSALPVIAFAAEHATAPVAAPEKHHTMQNANPSPKEAVKEAVDEVKDQAPEHTMKNANPSPKQVVKEIQEQAPAAPEHVMKNN